MAFGRVGPLDAHVFFWFEGLPKFHHIRPKNPNIHRNPSENTLPETNSKSPWKWMVGIRSFPFGMAYFQGRTVSFREGSTHRNGSQIPMGDAIGLVDLKSPAPQGILRLGQFLRTTQNPEASRENVKVIWTKPSMFFLGFNFRDFFLNIQLSAAKKGIERSNICVV